MTSANFSSLSKTNELIESAKGYIHVIPNFRRVKNLRRY